MLRGCANWGSTMSDQSVHPVRVGWQEDGDGTKRMRLELDGGRQALAFDRRNARQVRDAITEALIVMGEGDLLHDTTVETVINSLAMHPLNPDVIICRNEDHEHPDDDMAVVVEWDAPYGRDAMRKTCTNLRSGVVGLAVDFHARHSGEV